MSRRALVLAAVAAAGCGGRPPVYPAEVAVTAGGKPAVGVTVFLHPTAAPPAGERPIHPIATAGPDGVARFTSYAAYDGAAAGEYVVTLLYESAGVRLGSGPRPPAVKVPAELGDAATSKLRATVEPKPKNVLPPIALP